MAARRIESGKKVSSRKLWEIGRKTVEKKKQSLEKSKEWEDNKVYNSQQKIGEIYKNDHITNGAEFSKTQQDREKPRKKISTNDNNLRRYNRLNNPSDPNISNKQTKNPYGDFEQKSKATKPEDIAKKITKINEKPIQKYNHAARTGNSHRKDTSKPGQIKPNLTQTPTGNFSSLNRLQEKKQIITLPALIPKSLELGQPDVEEIMDIKPLAIVEDNITNKLPFRKQVSREQVTNNEKHRTKE
ncbi:unnamed protein product [Mytilus edulis]|uniref:Uncharacterized protein n=1 Tax=Mytilus edulis TaxID=6550 RepID=A0A8S3R3A3_MYTED|nr:unnamed protein product [Mytilus edulis]